MLLKAAGLCGKEINASEIMKHKASEVKELFHSGRKKQNQSQMDLKCPCRVFMTNGELSRLAGWVRWEEIKWLNIQTPLFFSRAANKEGV